MVASNQSMIEHQMNAALVDIYLRQSRTAVYSAFLLILFLASSFYHVAETQNIIIWVLAVLSVDMYILYTSSKFKQDLPLEKINFFKYRQVFLHVLVGLAWGSAFVLLLDAENPQPDDYRVAAVIGIVIAFSASTMSASLKGLVGFIISVSFLTAAHFISNFEYFRWWFFALIGLVASCLFFGWMTHQYIKGQIQHRLLNEAYTDDLKKLNAQVEANNHELIVKNRELESAQRRLQELARYDEMTGIYNRSFVLERLKEKLPELKRHKLNLCVVMVDIDHFKSINDRFGHAAGDDVLRSFAQILSTELRQGDMVARYGGEEFMILLPMTELPAAQLIIDRIREIVAKKVFSYKRTDFVVTSSFGITEYHQGDTLDTIIDRADNALYQAKRDGRNTVAIL